jgi:hypothetical protein
MSNLTNYIKPIIEKSIVYSSLTWIFASLLVAFLYNGVSIFEYAVCLNNHCNIDNNCYQEECFEYRIISKELQQDNTICVAEYTLADPRQHKYKGVNFNNSLEATYLVAGTNADCSNYVHSLKCVVNVKDCKATLNLFDNQECIDNGEHSLNADECQVQYVFVMIGWVVVSTTLIIIVYNCVNIGCSKYLANKEIDNFKKYYKSQRPSIISRQAPRPEPTHANYELIREQQVEA